jgi:YfiH family protein
MGGISDSGFPLWRFDRLANEPGLLHFVSTRLGGVSKEPYDSLNLGLRTADSSENVRENRARLFAALGVEPDQVASCTQVHGNRIVTVRRPPALTVDGGGPPEGDALATNAGGIMLMLLAADCAPVLVYDPIGRAAGVAHAGWRGTVGQVTRRLVQNMVDEFGSRPSDLLAAIGPSIGPCCYEVGEDVMTQVRSSLPSAEALLRSQPEYGKARLDLWQANVDQLQGAGVPRDSIELASVCTRCNCGTFFSDRAQRPSGRFAAGIMLRPIVQPN